MSHAVRKFARLGVTAACLTASLVWPILGYAQSDPMPELAGAHHAASFQTKTEEGVVRVDLSASGAATQPLTLPRGKSAIVELPVDARDVLVTNPAVADAVLRSPRRIYVMGVASGQTDAVFFDAAGRRILSLDIRVSQDTGVLNDTLARLLPGSAIRVEAVNDSVVLTGMVANAADADKAQRLAERFVAKPDMVVNMLTIAGKEQVMLKVRIVEMQRTVIKQLGFNLSTVLGQAGSPQFLFGTAASWGVNGALLGGLSGAGYALDTTTQPETMLYDSKTGAFDIPVVCRTTCTNGGQGVISTTQTTSGSTGFNKAGATVDAFERVGLIRTLAEPNLTAVSGESAKFLAGGEYPIPTSQSVTGQVSIEFKPYGVGLGFTPVVLSGGLISLKISTEVSQLTSQGAFTLATSSAATSTSSSSSSAGLTIPALTVRRAETTVELPSGGAMMIAGLMQQETQQDLDSLPGLMNMPVLGALFRSRDYQSGETELVVIVTPYIVKPTSPDKLQTPIDGLRTAGDLETNLLGKLNKTYKTPPEAVAGRSYQGPYGYVIE
jgi:pilus assembly protein CpaC